MLLTIIHFQPVEIYPPAINLIGYCTQHLPEGEHCVFTNGYGAELPEYNVPGSRIFRPTVFKKKNSKIGRLAKVLWFNIYTTIRLFALRPRNILYVETSSALPVFLYCLFFRKSVRVFIHYHEYTSPAQYRGGMLFDKCWHFLEQRFLYTRSEWISQTNEFRNQLFLRDNPGVDPAKLKCLPNYPPASWVVKANNGKLQSTPVKLVQLGSISTSHMYAKEFFNWIVEQEGRFVLDIYSLNIQPDILRLLKELNTPYIQYKGALSYEEIPEKLKTYDIGVVLYNAYSENVVYCASNKLFEYLALGLDVWVTKVMVGSEPYYRSNVYPKIVPVNYGELTSFNWQKAIDRQDLSFSPSPYVMEDVYSTFIKQLSR